MQFQGPEPHGEKERERSRACCSRETAMVCFNVHPETRQIAPCWRTNIASRKFLGKMFEGKMPFYYYNSASKLFQEHSLKGILFPSSINAVHLGIF